MEITLMELEAVVNRLNKEVIDEAEQLKENNWPENKIIKHLDGKLKCLLNTHISTLKQNLLRWGNGI